MFRLSILVGKGFTRAQLNADSSLLIGAGADTTAHTLSAMLFYLLHNPRVYDKVAKEVRSNFDSVDEISAYPGSKLTYLPYIKAVIEETLRLSPAAPIHLPRVVLKGGMTIDDEFFPEGTVVGVPSYGKRCPQYKVYLRQLLIAPNTFSDPSKSRILS